MAATTDMMGGLAGRRLGAYDVQALIGAGGMGEVYRARDTTLDRDVAIKVLSPEFVADADRLARFEHEARLLAALNHPNIAANYGVEDARLDDGGHVRGLVLELVEGETLADRIRRGPIPVTETLDIARQIALALQAAHDKGIVHRDLKPANVKVTPIGLVKVLDFGLAKACLEPLGADGTGTADDPAAQGIVMGTAAYMSPEQARGRVVDRRTDIWAFGCVVYEMLTGRAAFEGPTTSDTIANVLAKTPDLESISDGMPVSIRRMLRRCFAKNANDRLPDISDALLDITDGLASAAGDSVSAQPVPNVPATEPRRWIIGAVIVAATAVLALLAWWLLRAEPVAR